MFNAGVHVTPDLEEYFFNVALHPHGDINRCNFLSCRFNETSPGWIDEAATDGFCGGKREWRIRTTVVDEFVNSMGEQRTTTTTVVRPSSFNNSLSVRVLNFAKIVFDVRLLPFRNKPGKLDFFLEHRKYASNRNFHRCRVKWQTDDWWKGSPGTAILDKDDKTGNCSFKNFVRSDSLQYRLIIEGSDNSLVSPWETIKPAAMVTPADVSILEPYFDDDNQLMVTWKPNSRLAIFGIP